jgi:hypothetical protein
MTDVFTLSTQKQWTVIFLWSQKGAPGDATGIERYNRAIDPTTKTRITKAPTAQKSPPTTAKNGAPSSPPATTHPTPKNWNTLSLPFVVGPHGRIGKLNAKALAHNGARTSFKSAFDQVHLMSTASEPNLAKTPFAGSSFPIAWQAH